MVSKLKNFCGCLSLCLLTGLLINTRAFALDKKSSYAISHYIMGVVSEDLGDIDTAIDEYKKALKEDKESSAIHLRLAEGYIKKNDYPKAIEELKQVIGLDPEALEPHAIIALLYYSQNKLDLAAAEYELALKGASKLQPKNIDIYKSLGKLYLQQRKLKEAENTYKLIIGLAPLDAQPHFYLGSIYNELKDDNAAEKELERSIQLKPDYPDALNFLGYLYVEQNKNLDRAETMIKKALAIEPNNGAYVDSLGWLYFKKGKTKEALAELEKASGLMDDPVIFDHLGDAYLRVNDSQKAKLNWEKSLKLDPNQDNVKEKLKNQK